MFQDVKNIVMSFYKSLHQPVAASGLEPSGNAAYSGDTLFESKFPPGVLDGSLFPTQAPGDDTRIGSRSAIRYASDGLKRARAAYHRLKDMYSFVKSFLTNFQLPEGIASLFENLKLQIKELLIARKEVNDLQRNQYKLLKQAIKSGDFDAEIATTMMEELGERIHQSADEDEAVNDDVSSSLNQLAFGEEDTEDKEGEGDDDTPIVGYM